MSRLRSRQSNDPQTRVVSILVVDDDLIVGRSLCRALSALRPSYQVELATSAEDALVRVRTAAPHALVTDLEMGRVTGTELLELVARSYPAIARVVHSSRTEALRGTEMRRLAHAAFAKPADPAEILAAIELALAPPDPSSGVTP